MKKVLMIILLNILYYSDSFADSNGVIVFELSERLLTTSVIIGEALLLLLILFFWKRTKSDSNENYNSIFKQNIKALRTEKVRPIVDQNGSKKRVKMVNEININKLSGKLITRKAKKLSVSKGEIFLAARIQQLSSQIR